MNKAAETRQRNRELQAKKAEYEKRIDSAIVSACLAVLEDVSCTSEKKLKAASILIEVRKGH